MATLIRRRKPKDTIKKFEAVAERKYQAGLGLIDNADNHTGVEQLGYAAEMFLKSAYFRLVKSDIGLLRTTSEVTNSHLRHAAREGVRLSVPFDPESYHSLLFWATLLTATRRDKSRALPTDFEGELLSRARQLHQVWMIEHRYQPLEYQFDDVLRLRANVTWLRGNHRRFWR